MPRLIGLGTKEGNMSDAEDIEELEAAANEEVRFLDGPG